MLALVLLGLLPLVSISKLTYYVPGAYYEAIAGYLREQARLERLVGAKADLRRRFDFTRADDDPALLVLIISDALRSDHLHVNGYARPTTPQIERLGVISYGRGRACDSSTEVSVPCILTRGTLADATSTVTESSLISVLRGLGFATTWLSNQGYYSSRMTPITSIAHEAEHVYFNNRTGDTFSVRVTDEELLPEFEQALKRSVSKSLVVLHQVGVHQFYDSHYPEAFRIFTPTCRFKNPSWCSVEALSNSYDNGVRYADWVLGEVIRRVQDRTALVLLTSDHGESLGEGGRYGHLTHSGVAQQLDVPLLAWVSPSFMARYPERYAALRANMGAPWDHRFLFHTLLDCAGVKSMAIDERRSLCHAGDPSLATRPSADPATEDPRG